MEGLESEVVGCLREFVGEVQEGFTILDFSPK
jgi:hypothetical protein